MGTSLYDQYLQETGGPTKPAPPLPAPPLIAAPDVTRVAPRPPAEPPSEPFIQKVARVNKAVRKALPLTGPLEQLETGAKKIGEDQGKFLLAQDPGKMPRAQDYPDAESYSKAFADYGQRYTRGLMNVAATTGVPEGAEVPKRPLANVPFDAYSRLENAVAKAPFERGTAEQWKAALTPNVAAGERQWRGIDQLLEAKKGQLVTRDELQQHLAANPISIGRSQYGGRPRPVDTEGWVAVRDPNGYSRDWIVTTPDNPNERNLVAADDATSAIDRIAERKSVKNFAKFGQYKEPGGENYTENVLTLGRDQTRLPKGYQVKEVPNTADGFGHNGVQITDPTMDEYLREQVDPEAYYGANPEYQAWKARERKPAYAVHDAQGQQVTDDYPTPEEAIKAGHIYAKYNTPTFAQPGHFPDKNPLAHYRFTDHVLPNGEKVRFLEEMQSDWHQQGRREGYRPREGDSYTVATHPTDPNAFTILGPQGRPLTGTGTELPLHYTTLGDATEAVRTLQKHGTAVPDAPFKKTEEWTELALKDAIDQAKKDGIDRIAWTTGDQQAARYDLSKHVDRITYQPETGALSAWKDGHSVHEGVYDQRALPDVIGKEAADNLMKPENAVGLEGEQSQILEGEGLKVGGSGMRAYYDKMVPKVVQDYAKKRGVKLQLEPVNIFHTTTGGYEGPEPTAAKIQEAMRRELADPQSDGEDSPIYMQLQDMMHRVNRGTNPRTAVEASLSDLRSDMGGGVDEADMVAHALGGKYTPPSEPATNQSFSLKNLPEGPQPLWAAGAAGVAGTAALQQGGDDKNKGGDLYKQFQAEQQKQPQSLYDQYQAEQEAGKPKPSIWDRLKSINAGVRQALVPDALQQLETGATKFGKEQGEWGVQLAKDLKYVVDPARKAESGRPPTEESKAVDRRILAALATVALPAGVRKIFEDWVIARGIRPPAPPSAEAPPVSPAIAERAPWDRSATAPPPVDQPQPLRPEQQALRARLATEGITPAGAITRRPPTAPPPVEPGPEAQTFSTKGAVRRPAPAAPPVEAVGQPEAPAVERRAENPPDRTVWSPEDRARYISESQKAYAAKINKPWSQWTPEEKAGYFADQARVRAGAPWQQEVAQARQIVGDEEFSRRSIAAAAQVPPEQKLEAIKQTAHEIVAGGETAHFPPEPKPGDLTPVVSSNSEFAARPGVMRDVNKGQQPTALNSPLRLPEPTPEDRAIVQPKGYKEVSPEEVAARKAAQPPPAPVAEGHPVRQEMPQGATVDENGLFFEHRTPSGQLRDFRRVSTEGLIKAHREMQEQIGRDQQLAIYRTVENENMSGTGDRTMFQAATKTARGTSQQAEAAERLRNYQKVMDRLDAELKNRGMSSGDVYNAIQAQEEHEAAIEQEAIHHADATDEADTAFGDFGDLVPEEEPTTRNRQTGSSSGEKPVSDVLNVAKLNLGSKTAEQRMAAKLEEFRTQRESNKQTFAEADVNRNDILNELRAGDPLALPTEKAKKLSGEQLLARRDLVRENDQTIAELSKRMEAGMPPEAYSQAAALVQRAVEHNDALLSDLVTGSSQKGRDLNLLRRMANNSLDPAVWRVQAKRMLGDRPLTAEIDAAIRKLAQEAEDACQ